MKFENIKYRSNKIQEDYCRYIVKLGFFASVRALKYHLNFLFPKINFKDKSVLDIGGGVGIYSFYAGCMGAKKVICLEPELAGSSKGLRDIFNTIKSELGSRNVYFIPKTFQEYEGEDVFDIVILYDSINHLNEVACTKLKESKIAEEHYINIFRKLYKITRVGSKVIICDCSDKNFFNLIGSKNFFAPSIEWGKHQSPQLWAKLLGDCGFKKEKIKWSSPNRWGTIGNRLMGNRFISYFTTSHFCLLMKRI